VGFFRRYKRFAGFQDDSLKERGIAGSAKVLEARETGLYAGGRGTRGDSDYVESDPIYDYRLVVTLPGQAPYEVEHRAQGWVPAGSDCPVDVDPTDRTKLLLDSWGRALDETARALSQYTGQPIASDGDAIAQAAEDLAKQWQQWQPGMPMPGQAPPEPTSGA
jgi:DNA-binding transcriptional LysR family regulator